MCRFISYLGNDAILISKLLEEPKNSLIKQSRSGINGNRNLNADGSGLAWYNHEINNEPGIFKSTQPAWNNNNFKHLSQKIKSRCFLAHIRASTIGDVTLNNCHPFSHKEYSFVHNGTIRNFHKIKRSLMQELNNDLFHEIKGQTDSELLFFLIINFIKKNKTKSLESAVKKAFSWIVDVQRNGEAEDFSKLNIVITDGKELMATRFSSKDAPALSLNYLTHTPEQPLNNDEFDINKKCVIIASEPLDDYSSPWISLPENNYITVKSDDLNIHVRSF